MKNSLQVLNSTFDEAEKRNNEIIQFEENEF